MRRTLFLLSASLLTVTACTSQTTGTPSPSSSTPSQTSPSGPADEVPGPGVPKVENPIDVSHFQQAPCDSLTAAQITELLGGGITPQPAIEDPAGPTCNWHSPSGSQASVGVTYFNRTKLGITGIYQAKDKVYPFFMPMDPIDGYPIVAFGEIDERKTRGRCSIALGTSDNQQVDMSVALSEANIEQKDPCSAARDVASKVLDNLRKAK
jgi:hypothetical protein